MGAFDDSNDNDSFGYGGMNDALGNVNGNTAAGNFGNSDNDVSFGGFGNQGGYDAAAAYAKANPKRGYFQPGQNVEIQDRSFQSPGTVGREISRDPAFSRAKSEFQQDAGRIGAGLIGGLIGIPGLGAVLNRMTASGVYSTDAEGNMLMNEGFGNSPENGKDIQTINNAMLAMENSSVPIAVNASGELVDNSGALVNETGQRVTPDGRPMSDSDIAIERSLGFQDQASADATNLLQTGRNTSIDNLQNAANYSNQANQNAFNFANNTLTNGFNRADQLMSTGYNQGAQQLRTGSNTARNDINSGRDSALGYLQANADRGVNGLEAQYQETRADLNPFLQAGQGSLAREQDFLGLNGVDAQQGAYDNFLESPGQAWQREKQEQARVRNASATGGLGGGRVQMALQEDAFGRASTRLDDQLNRLSTLSARGQQAGNDIGQFGAQKSGRTADLLQNLGVNQSNVATSAATQNAGNANALGQNLSSLSVGEGQNRGQLATNLGSNLANANSNMWGRNADIATNLGQNQSNINQNLSSNLSNLTLGAGENRSSAVLGGQVANATSQSEANRIAAMQQQQDSQNDASFNNALMGFAGDAFGGVASRGIDKLFGGLF